MPERSARNFTASGKLRFSISMMNLKMSPPEPHPKHLKICLLSLTRNEGVFSA